MPTYNKKTDHVPKGYKAWWSFNEGTGLITADRDFNHPAILTTESLWTDKTKKGRAGIRGLGDDAQKINLPAISNLFNITSEFTVAYWLYDDGTPSIITSSVLNLNSDLSFTASNNIGLRFILGTDGEIRFRVIQGVLTGYNGGDRGYWNTGVFTKPQSWNLVFCQRNLTSASCYVYNTSGLHSASVELGGSFTLNSWSAGLGNVNNNIAGYTSPDGSQSASLNTGLYLCELAVWDRTVTEQEREFMWDGGSGKVPTNERYDNYTTSLTPYKHLPLNNPVSPSYIPVDYTIYDSSGNNQHGKYIGHVDRDVQSQMFENELTAYFNGVNQYGRLPPSLITQITNHDFSIECWLYVDLDDIEQVITTNMVFLAITDTNATVGGVENVFLIGLDFVSNVPLIHVNGANIFGSINIQSRKVTHIVVVHDSVSNVVRMYVDGVEDTGAQFPFSWDQTTTSGSFTNATAISVAQEYDTKHRISNFYRGTIDRLAIYDTALSTLTVSCNELIGRQTNSTKYDNRIATLNPIAYYKFQEPNTQYYTSYDDYIEASDALVFIKFDEVQGAVAVIDNGERKVNGTYFGSPLLEQKALITDGGTCAYFDGIDDYISFPLTLAHQIVSAITIQAWINIPTIPSGTTYRIVQCSATGETPDTNGWLLYLASGGELRWFHEYGNGVNYTVPSGYFININTTYHLVVTISATGQLYMYSNGDIVFSTILTDMPSGMQSARLYIGSSEGNTDFFKGFIDSVSIHNVVLSENTIKDVYDLGTSNRIVKKFYPIQDIKKHQRENQYVYNQTILECNPKLYYTLNENDTTFNDTSGNEYHATSSGNVIPNRQPLINQPGYSVLFDGVDSSIDGPLIGPAFSFPFCVEIWTIPSATGINFSSHNHQQQASEQNVQHGVQVFVSTSTVTVTIGDGIVDGAVDVGFKQFISDDLTPYNLTTPLHVFVVCNSITDVTIYVNAKMIAINATTGTATIMDTSQGNVSIGKYFTNGTQNFSQGTVDSVAIYNTTLKPSEITYHYKIGRLGSVIYEQDLSANNKSGHLAFNPTPSPVFDSLSHNVGLLCDSSTLGRVRLGTEVSDNQRLMVGTAGSLIFSFTPKWSTFDGLTHTIGSKGYNDDFWSFTKRSVNDWLIGFVINGITYQHQINGGTFIVLADTTYRLCFTWDTTEGTSSLYVNGLLISNSSIVGTVNYATSDYADDLTLGGSELENQLTPTISANGTFAQIMYYETQLSDYTILHDAYTATHLNTNTHYVPNSQFSYSELMKGSVGAAWIVDTSQLFNDQGRTTIAAIGDSVESFSDLSGLQFHANGQTGSGPTLQQDVDTGKFYLSFNGTSQYLVIGDSGDPSSTTVWNFLHHPSFDEAYVCFALRPSPSTNNYNSSGTVLATNSGTTTQTGFDVFIDDRIAGGVSEQLVLLVTDGTNQAPNLDNRTENVIDFQTDIIIEVIRNGNTYSQYVNGMLIATGTATGLDAEPASSRMHIGKSGTNDFFATYWLYGGIVMSKIPSDLQRSKLLQNMADKCIVSPFNKRQDSLYRSAVGYWDAYDAVRLTTQPDKSPSSITGTAIGTATVDHNKWLFDGSGAVNLGTSLNGTFGAADSAFSVSIRCAVSSLNTSGVVFGKNGTFDDTRSFIFRFTGGLLDIIWYQSPNNVTDVRKISTSISSYNDNIEREYTIVYNGAINSNDGADRITVYVDGVEVSTSVTYSNGTLSDIALSTARLSIGAAIGATGSTVETGFIGSVTRVAVYNYLISSHLAYSLAREIL